MHRQTKNLMFRLFEKKKPNRALEKGCVPSGCTKKGWRGGKEGFLNPQEKSWGERGGTKKGDSGGSKRNNIQESSGYAKKSNKEGEKEPGKVCLLSQGKGKESRGMRHNTHEKGE